MINDLRTFISLLRSEHELSEISAPVDPHLEAAEIHRRVIAEGGSALLFKSINGAGFPLVTNLFGTLRRVELAFGTRPELTVQRLVKFVQESMPPSIGKLWQERSLLSQLLHIGTKKVSNAPVAEVCATQKKLLSLPLLTTWKEDGGPFITLPLVYTQHPRTGVHNLGMYRLQRFDDDHTGFHCQIGKGAGYHLAAAREMGVPLPVNVHIGGAPALILAAIAPLPENVPELLLASLALGHKVRVTDHAHGPLPLISDVEFALIGEVDPNSVRPEGPFGDHYGYYSLCHDYPVFRCHKMLHRRDAICAATVVGKPRQEDYYIGEYLQRLLRPLFPLVMPTVCDLWSYGETGFHSLAAAVVRQRYKREAMVSAFRILGEGQLSLTKFLLVLDTPCELSDFKYVLEHVLERCDFRTDLYVFSNLAMDTLDYTGPKVNDGSKGVLLGVGAPIRRLPGEFHGIAPSGSRSIQPFCRGCLVVGGPTHSQEPDFATRLAHHADFSEWPLIVLVDDTAAATRDSTSFLWTTFTRFEPGADIFAASKEIVRNHVSYRGPVVIDARMKKHYPDELNCDPETASLVSRRWQDYFGRTPEK